MPKVIISDTSTLVLFESINQIELLNKVYGNILTTPEVAKEFGEPLPTWIIIKQASDIKYQRFLETLVDAGEASAIALATEYDDVLLILDDLKARKLATQLEFKITGALGVINKAKQMAIIPLVKPLIEELLKTNFRISEKIINQLLEINDELL